jgi:hypothetical protein
MWAIRLCISPSQATRRVLNALNLQLKFNVWYLDDGKLIGKHADLRRALDYILSEGPALGLYLNLSKCSVW